MDANIVLYLLGGNTTLAELLEGKKGYLSVITELELIGYPNVTEGELSRIQDFISGCEVVPVTAAIRKLYMNLRHRYKLKLGNAAAAATALYLGLPFVTADKGFRKVEELELMLFAP